MATASSRSQPGVMGSNQPADRRQVYAMTTQSVFIKENHMSILSDVKDIEAKVREAMENGPVTPYYSLPLEKVYETLNAALASELVCVMRYRQHYYMTTSIHQEQLQGLFKEHWQ